ncbi:hypothetical protein QU41_02115 [Bradyrhizobium elkanii]|jgi:enoyl-CoA hydratase/carnithine racemase|nr:hypothetical protein QU41_02115 [Bradyrhizobium elkanii]
MTDNSVLLEKRGQALWITINRPDKRNALNAGVIAGIAKGYRDAHDDKDVNRRSNLTPYRLPILTPLSGSVWR